jgi:hypothetical protein
LFHRIVQRNYQKNGRIEQNIELIVAHDKDSLAEQRRREPDLAEALILIRLAKSDGDKMWSIGSLSMDFPPTLI